MKPAAHHATPPHVVDPTLGEIMQTILLFLAFYFIIGAIIAIIHIKRRATRKNHIPTHEASYTFWVTIPLWPILTIIVTLEAIGAMISPLHARFIYWLTKPNKYFTPLAALRNALRDKTPG